jgi:low affinity Fe/Cu permease
VVKTGTSIITFLIVFLIQQCQNKATIAFLLRLNELIAANKRGSNRLIDIEDLDAKELQQLKKFYTELRDLAEKEKDLSESHSLREALEIQKEKKSIQQASVQLKIK